MRVAGKKRNVIAIQYEVVSIRKVEESNSQWWNVPPLPKTYPSEHQWTTTTWGLDRLLSNAGTRFR